MTNDNLKKDIQKTIEKIDDQQLRKTLYHTLNNCLHDHHELNEADLKMMDEQKSALQNSRAATYAGSEVRKKILENLSK